MPYGDFENEVNKIGRRKALEFFIQRIISLVAAILIGVGIYYLSK